jgi:3-methylcrotonyl-CoA carboxylase beta subunit
VEGWQVNGVPSSVACQGYPDLPMPPSSPSKTGLRELCAGFAAEEAAIREAGDSPAARQRQHALRRLTARERVARLLDDPADFFELGLWAAHGMYPDWGETPAAGLIAGIGRVSGRSCLIAANDATVKAGAFFPQTVKKLLRAQRIAFECALPLIYLVDSSGVFLPLQDEIFPDEDDFGRIFRNNAVLSAAGVPQYAAIMGSCVAGGAYLPVLCDKILMTEGSGLYLAGPSLVKAAIGQEISSEELGGAAMHSAISGTVDFHEPDDASCLARLRGLVALLPAENPVSPSQTSAPAAPARNPQDLYDFVSADGSRPYDARDLLACIVDGGSLQESKAEYGQTLVTAYARLSGRAVGIVASQRLPVRTKTEGIQMGGVLYADSADKAARFVMDCNQTGLPLIFFQDVQGFMVGRDAEASGIIRSGAKLVNAVSNSVVPKLTVIVGGSFGAGHYALCGKAYDPRFILAWPNARYAVMGAAQAAEVVYSLLKRKGKDKGGGEEEDEALRERVQRTYQEQTGIRYGAARGWVDAVIPPYETRSILTRLLDCAVRPAPPTPRFHMGVTQV